MILKGETKVESSSSSVRAAWLRSGSESISNRGRKKLFVCPDMGATLKGVHFVQFGEGHNDDLMSHPDFLMRRP